MITRRQVHTCKSRKALALVAITVACAAVLAWRSSPAIGSRNLVYTSKGFGGWVPAQPAQPGPTDPLAPIESSYAAGKYAEAETAAQAEVLKDERAADPAVRRNAARAMWVMAYCSARQGDYSAARDRFQSLREAASRLPDRGTHKQVLGEQQPTLEEEGAFQHAVCVGALNDKRGAEAEYRDFLKEFPQSVLVHAAVKRIAKFHGGDIPQDAVALWTHDMKLQAASAEQQRREESLCGPECIAELVRRSGHTADPHALADEMQTTDNGTTMDAMARASKRRGLPGIGMRMDSLRHVALPVITIVDPGHYVIVDRVSDKDVKVWDPDLHGIGKGGDRTYSPEEWDHAWIGAALVNKSGLSAH